MRFIAAHSVWLLGVSSLLSPALAQESGTALSSQWTLTGVQQLPPAAPGVDFLCPKILTLSDELTAVKFADSEPGRQNALPPFVVEGFLQINSEQKCFPTEVPPSLAQACLQTTRDLNGDVWAMTRSACRSQTAKPCTVPDVRWTVTARPSQLVVRMDCKAESCPTPVRMGQCTYAWLKGEVRKGDGARHSDEDEHDHHHEQATTGGRGGGRGGLAN